MPVDVNQSQVLVTSDTTADVITVNTGSALITSEPIIEVVTADTTSTVIASDTAIDVVTIGIQGPAGASGITKAFAIAMAVALG